MHDRKNWKNTEISGYYGSICPPDMKAAKFRELCDTLVSEVAAVKVALGDPIIYVAGDFNHRDVGPSVSLAANLTLVPTGPTRGCNTLDLIYSNAGNNWAEAEVLPPLDTPAGVESNHRCVYIRDGFPPARNYTRVAKLRRTRTKASEDASAVDLGVGIGPRSGLQGTSTRWRWSWRK